MDPKEELSLYIGNPRCQGCGWKLGTDITDNCGCNGNMSVAKGNLEERLQKYLKAFKRARELQAIVEKDYYWNVIKADKAHS
jgi:hypothetical protein